MKNVPSYDFPAPLDLSMPALPPRSRLHALQPLGLNTGMVEALSSYLTRLARSHAVTLRRLIREEFRPIAPESSRTATSNQFDFRIGAVDGLDERARTFAAVTAELTTIPEVRFLTLLPIDDVLPQCGVAAIAPRPRWCPDCQREMRQQGEVYRPLVWSLDLYGICHIHRRPLLETCPHCDAHQPFVPGFPDLGRCNRCGHHLWTKVRQRTAKGKETETWVAASLAELVAALPDLDRTDCRANLLQFVRSTADNVSVGSHARLCLQMGQRQTAMDNFLLRNGRPRLRQLLAIAYGAGVSPSAMLQFDVQAATVVREVPLEITTPAKSAWLSPRRREKIRQQLAAAATDPKDVRPVAAIARQLGLKRHRLRYWFPTECADVSAKHALAKRNATAERRSTQQRAVADAVRDFMGRGEFPSQWKVGKLLASRKIAMRKPYLVQAYRDAVAEYRSDAT